MFAITEVSLKDLYTIIKEFKDLPYEGYARNRSTHIPTDSYFYLERNIEKFMMRNSRGLLRTQNMSTQKMSNSRVCSMDERESRSINVNMCYMNKRKPKSVHEMDMSVNTSEVKYTKDEEPSVMDILLIKAPGYFKLFECGKEFFNNLDAAYECACMENAKDKYWG